MAQHSRCERVVFLLLCVVGGGNEYAPGGIQQQRQLHGGRGMPPPRPPTPSFNQQRASAETVQASGRPAVVRKQATAARMISIRW